MPILGIMASQISGHLATPNNYESIATTTLTSNSTTITFSSIPATFKHLQIRSSARSTGSDGYIKVQFNSDTGANYSYHYLEGNGSTTSAGGGATQNQIYVFGFASTTASIFGASVIDILDYANTNKYKTTRTLSGYDMNGSGYIDFDSGNWRSTSAITSIDLIIVSGNNFAQYSSFALYGVK